MQINGWLGSSSNDSLRSQGRSADQPDYNWYLFLNKSICLTQFCPTCGTVGRDILLNQSYPSPFHSKLPLLPMDTFVVKVKGGGWSLYWWKIEQCDHLSPAGGGGWWAWRGRAGKQKGPTYHWGCIFCWHGAAGCGAVSASKCTWWAPLRKHNRDDVYHISQGETARILQEKTSSSGQMEVQSEGAPHRSCVFRANRTISM